MATQKRRCLAANNVPRTAAARKKSRIRSHSTPVGMLGGRTLGPGNISPRLVVMIATVAI